MAPKGKILGEVLVWQFFFFLLGLMGMYAFPPNHVSVPEERNLIQQSSVVGRGMESKGRGSYGYSDFKITSGSGAIIL